MLEKQHKNTALSGSLLVLASAIIFSLGGVVIKLLPWHSLSINAARNGVALLITAVFVRCIRHKLVFNKSVLLGAAAMAATTTLFCLATKMTTAANAILLQYTSPVFIILYSWLFFRQKPKKLDIGMCVASFAGIACFFMDSLSGGHLVGDGLALAAGAAYAVVFMSNLLPGGDAISAFFFGEVLSTAIGLPWLVQETAFTPAALAGGIGLGVIIGGGYVLLSIALCTTPPVAANLLSAVEPVLNPMWVALFYGEILTPLAMAGFIIVLASVVVYNVLVQRKRSEK